MKIQPQVIAIFLSLLLAFSVQVSAQRHTKSSSEEQVHNQALAPDSLLIQNQSQTKVDSLPLVIQEDVYGSYKLPELKSCIDSALVNSPLLKTTDEQVAQLLEAIKIKKKYWLDYILIDANARYGLFNQLSFSQQSGASSIPDLDLFSAEERFSYFAGLTVRMPLSVFSSRHNQVKMLKHNINEAELKREELKNEITRLVITEYFKLKTSHEMLGYNQENVMTAQLDYLKAKNDQRDNMINMTTLASVTYQYTKSLEAYVYSKNDFFAQFYILKVLTGSIF